MHEWRKMVRMAEEERDREEMWNRAFHDLERRETVAIGSYPYLSIFHAEVLRQGVRYVHPKRSEELPKVLRCTSG